MEKKEEETSPNSIQSDRKQEQTTSFHRNEHFCTDDADLNSNYYFQNSGNILNCNLNDDNENTNLRSSFQDQINYIESREVNDVQQDNLSSYLADTSLSFTIRDAFSTPQSASRSRALLHRQDTENEDLEFNSVGSASHGFAQQVYTDIDIAYNKARSSNYQTSRTEDPVIPKNPHHSSTRTKSRTRQLSSADDNERLMPLPLSFTSPTTDTQKTSKLNLKSKLTPSGVGLRTLAAVDSATKSRKNFRPITTTMSADSNYKQQGDALTTPTALIPKLNLRNTNIDVPTGMSISSANIGPISALKDLDDLLDDRTIGDSNLTLSNLSAKFPNLDDFASTLKRPKTTKSRIKYDDDSLPSFSFLALPHENLPSSIISPSVFPSPDARLLAAQAGNSLPGTPLPLSSSLFVSKGTLQRIKKRKNSVELERGLVRKNSKSTGDAKKVRKIHELHDHEAKRKKDPKVGVMKQHEQRLQERRSYDDSLLQQVALTLQKHDLRRKQDLQTSTGNLNSIPSNTADHVYNQSKIPLSISLSQSMTGTIASPKVTADRAGASPCNVMNSPHNARDEKFRKLEQEMEDQGAVKVNCSGQWTHLEEAILLHLALSMMKYDLKVIAAACQKCGIDRKTRAVDKKLKRMLHYKSWKQKPESEIAQQMRDILNSHPDYILTEIQTQQLQIIITAFTKNGPENQYNEVTISAFNSITDEGFKLNRPFS